MLELPELANQDDLVEVSCPACGSTDASRILRRNGLRVVRCNRCSSLFANPRPHEDALVDIYRRYPQLANGREGQTVDDPDDGRWEAEYRIRCLQEIKTSGRLLDLGCGRGDFLAAARPFFDVQGVDIAPRLRPTYEGIPVFEGPLEAAGFEEGSFDVVAAVEVLEHLFDPKRTLTEIHRILRPRGILLLQTGDVDSLRPRLSLERWTYVQPPVHLNFFTRRGLLQFLQDGGFQVQRNWSFGRAPKKVPGLARLARTHGLRTLLDVAAREGFVGQMHAATKREVT